jgi:hypothetical protein
MIIKERKKETLSILDNKRDIAHMILAGSSIAEHEDIFVKEDKLFFVKFRVLFLWVFATNERPVTKSAFANEVTPSIKGPGLNFLKQRRIANKPFVPETKGLVRALDAPGFVAFACAPIQSGADGFRESPNDVKDIVRQKQFGHDE